jgi:hypothetical protein
MKVYRLFILLIALEINALAQVFCYPQIKWQPVDHVKNPPKENGQANSNNS